MNIAGNLYFPKMEQIVANNEKVFVTLKSFYDGTERWTLWSQEENPKELSFMQKKKKRKSDPEGIMVYLLEKAQFSM